MKEAYRIADQNSNCRKAADQARRNKGKLSQGLQQGDRVLLRNLTPRGGPGKLRSYWEPNIYNVVSQVGDSGMVYSIAREDKSGKPKTVHRNLLYPCEELPIEGPPSRQNKRAKENRVKQTVKPKDSNNLPSEEAGSESNNSDDVE